MRKTILLSIVMIAMAVLPMSAINFGSKVAQNVLGDTKDTMVISTLDSLKLAISGATKDRLILLRKCSDASGYYALGSTGLAYPTTFINLELRNYPGDTAKVYGSITSTTARMKLNSYTINGLYWERVATGDAEGMSAFYFLGADTIKTGLYVKNCTFLNLGGSGSARLFYTKAAGIKINEVLFENNIIDNFGGVTADGAHGQTMFQLANYSYECDSLVIKNNLIRDFHGNIFINNDRQQMTSSKDSVMYIVVEGNTFYRFGGNGTSDRSFIQWTNKMAGCDAYVTVKNNLFYKNWSTKYFKCWKLAMFSRDLTLGQIQDVKVLNNYFEPADVVKALATTNTTTGASSSTYSNFTKESFGIVNTFVDTLNLVISIKSPLYTASTTGGPIGLASMYSTSTEPARAASTVQVNCITGLKNAIKGAVDGDIIELLNCTDAAGYYALGKDGITYPSTFVDLTIRPATGNTPLVYGSFGSTATPRMKIKSYTFDNVTFKADTLNNAEGYNPFYLTANDSITTGLFYKNCKFLNMGYKSTGPRIFYAKTCALAVCHALVYDGCTFDNFGYMTPDGTNAEHFLHFNTGTYDCDSIVLKNSIISDWHGNQFINFGKDKLTTRKDSTMRLIVENNSFIRFGANATSLRNFVEYTRVVPGQKEEITIQNNLFYKRWGKNKPNCQLALHTPSAASGTLPAEILNVKILNNFFDPDTVVNALPVSAGVPTSVTRANLTKASFGMVVPTFINDTTLTMSTKSPLYTAGTTGGQIGALRMYSDTTIVTRTAPATVQVNCIVGLKAAVKNAFDGDIIELLNCTDAVGYYKLGTTGLAYPSTFVDLTIRPATGNTPLVYGSFGSDGSPRMKLKNLTFNDVTFKADLTDLAENNQCFYLQANDSITGGLFYNNCLFQDLGGAASGPRIFYAKSCTNAVLKKLVYDGCTFKNYGGAVADGATGNHFLHFNNAAYICDSVVLKNSIIREWHGSQFINIGRQSTNNKDSLFTLIIENNTFYKFGGNATSDRNFVECTRDFGGSDVNMTIKNNLFYQRWGKNKPVMNMALFTPKVGQILKVDILNNFFDPDTVVKALPVSAGAPTSITRNDLTKSSLGMLYIPTFVNDTLLIMSIRSILYTAGTTGGCIGAPSLYTSDAVQEVGVEKTKTTSKKLNGYATNNMIYVLGAEKMVTLYNVIGQKLGTFTAEEAEQGIALKSKGIVIVNSDGETIRLMVR
jgi:hypothetical protein